MKRRARTWLTCMAMLGLALLLVAEPALAQTTPTTGTSTSPVSKCSDYAGLTNRIVSCVRDTLSNVMVVYFDKDSGFYPLVQKAIAGFLTLGVAIYGLMAAFGMLEKVGRDTVVLVLKLCFITWCCTNTPYLYKLSIDLMDGAAGAVVQFAPDPSVTAANDGTQSECLKNMKEAAAKSETSTSAPWLAVDCMIDSVIGIKIPTSVSGKAPTKGEAGKWWNDRLEGTGMARGMLNLFFSSMQSSVIGVILAVVGFIFVYSMVFLLVKALLVYLGGYIGISFMMIFAPLFIPLILFRKTKDYFDKWLKLVISFALQPVIILVFICFTILAVDLAMFSADYSIMYRIAGEESRKPGFNLNKYMETHKIVKKQPTVAAEVKINRETPGGIEKSVGGLFSGATTSECTRELMGKTDDATKAKAREVCGDTFPMQWWRNSIDWKAMAAARKPEVADPGPEEEDPATMTAEDRKGRLISREVMAAVIFAAITVFVMNGLLTVIPMVANDLVGDSFQSPNLYQMASKRSRGLDGISQSLSGMFSGGRRR